MYVSNKVNAVHGGGFLKDSTLRQYYSYRDHGLMKSSGYGRSKRQHKKQIKAWFNWHKKHGNICYYTLTPFSRC